MDDEGRYTVGVAGVIKNANGEVLLIKTAQAGWELPGGRVERGEDLIEAFERELQEECGCQAVVTRLVGLSSNTGSSDLILFTLAGTHSGGEPHAGDDSLDAGWFAPDLAVQMVTHRAEGARLRDALAQVGGVIYRVYGDVGGGAEQSARYEL